MGDKKQLILLIFVLIGIGAVAYTWYPRLFPKKVAVRAPRPLLQAPKLIEVPAETPAPPTKAKPAPSQLAKAPQAPEKEKAERAMKPPTPAERGPTRFSLELPPFVIAAEADECERRLNQDGLPTSRSITYMENGLYAVLVGPFPNAARAAEVRAEVKAKSGSRPSEQRGPNESFFEDGPYNLREVIRRALEIRKKGYGLRIIQVEGKAPIYRVRTAPRLDTAQASKLSGHYRELGCPNRVVATQ